MDPNAIRLAVDLTNELFGAGVSRVAHKLLLQGPIRLDEIALNTMAAQGCGPDSVPQPGVCVMLRNNANLSTGGTATDVTDHVHPDLAASAVMAARMVGLDVCGIDLVSRDVYQPLTPDEAASPAVAAYQEAFALLEARDPKARQAFAALVGLHGEDPLALFHLGRLLGGETGAEIDLAGM